MGEGKAAKFELKEIKKFLFCKDIDKEVCWGGNIVSHSSLDILQKSCEVENWKFLKENEFSVNWTWWAMLIRPLLRLRHL